MKARERDLRMKRSEVLNNLREIQEKADEENRGLNAEEDSAWKKGKRRIEMIDLELTEFGDYVEQEAVRMDPNPSRIADLGEWRDSEGNPVRLFQPEERAFAGMDFKLPDGIRPDELDTGRWMRGALTGNWKGAEAEYRAMSTYDNVAGGYLMPMPLSARTIDLARNQSALIRAGALTLPMESKDLTIARVTSDPTGYWKQENASGTESSMQIGALKFTAKTLIALVKMSQELFEDAPNAGEVLEHALAEALRIKLDLAGLFGTGANNQPKGLYYDSNLGNIDCGTNGSVIADYSDFISAVQAVYEANGNPVAALYSPRTFAAIDGLTDQNDQPLKGPKSFEMLRHVISNQVANDLTKGSSSNASVAFVGDFSKVVLGVRTAVTIEFSREASDSSSSAFKDLQVWARAYLRADWQVFQPSHISMIEGIIPS